jgi:hypothetical protein
MMNTLLKSLLLVLALASTTAYAVDNSGYNSRGDRYSNRDNEPKSYTLSGSNRGARDRYNDDSYSNSSRKSERDSYGSNGVTRSGNQINDNGLIINQE